MLMQWVNHASFILESGAVRLITDPWLEGMAFNNSWSLLSPTKLTYEDFKSITHIWFSHEHPDHFSPPNLKKIPEEYRRRITVLFHETKDKRVVNVCKSLGFLVEELPEGQVVDVENDFKVLSGVKPLIDSWIAIFAEGKTVLNMNDCVFGGRTNLAKIKRRVEKVDVLLSQFSYANWVGNQDDRESQRNQAARKRAEMMNQIRLFQPAQFIPFASFVYFCHAENFFMNQEANRIRDVYELAASELQTETIVLYPGERWEVGTARNSRESIQRYEADLERAVAATPVASPSVEMPKLQLEAKAFVEKCERRNNRLLLNAMSPAVARLSDLKTDVEISFRDGLQEVHGKHPDIVISSDSLSYCLKTDWGGETLLINGRFEAPRGGSMRRFFRLFRVPQHNSYGNSLNLRFLTGQMLEKARSAVAR